MRRLRRPAGPGHGPVAVTVVPGLDLLAVLVEVDDRFGFRRPRP